MENELERNIKPKLRDIVPFYGGVDYIRRTTYPTGDRVSEMKKVVRGVLTSVQIIYNSFAVADLLNLMNGKHTIASKILEKIIE